MFVLSPISGEVLRASDRRKRWRQEVVTNVWRERAQQILEITGVATVKVLADDRDVCGFDVFHLYLLTYGTRL
jgi:hypothetical protein